MASHVHHPVRALREIFVLLITVSVFAGLASGQSAIALTPKDGPPTTTLRVSGSGFTPYAQIDIYFDNQDQALAVADAAGAFNQIAIQAPKSAVPGNHWVTAAERSGHLVKQEIFQVHVNWTEFHTKDMRRENPYENVLNVDNVGSLRLKGSYNAMNSPLYSSPAVVNGVAYFGSAWGLHAVNVSTGALLWLYPTYWVTSSPAVADGIIYFASRDQNVYALDVITGGLMWSYQTAHLVQPQSSPLVANGLVYIGSDTSVYALSAKTGDVVWVSTLGPDWVYSSPAVANGIIYVGSQDEYIHALSARTGVELWSYLTGSLVYSSPAVANGVVYVGSANQFLNVGGVYALDANAGALLWSYTAGQVTSSPAVANGVVYVGSNDGNVYALDAGTGALLWSYATGGSVESSPAVANGVVYIGSDDHNVYALNATTGVKLWSYTTGDVVNSSPTVVNGVLYVTSEDDNIYAFHLAKGLTKQSPPRPDPKSLRPDINLKTMSTPVTN